MNHVKVTRFVAHFAVLALLLMQLAQVRLCQGGLLLDWGAITACLGLLFLVSFFDCIVLVQLSLLFCFIYGHINLSRVIVNLAWLCAEKSSWPFRYRKFRE